MKNQPNKIIASKHPNNVPMHVRILKFNALNCRIMTSKPFITEGLNRYQRSRHTILW